MQTLEGHSGTVFSGVNSAQFSPDGTNMAIGKYSLETGTVRVWSVSGECCTGCGGAAVM